ncbi:MAG: o-succinylbenzoate synthase [Chloroflexota bacterium]
MKIDQIIIYHVRMKLKSPFETSFGRNAYRDCLIIKVLSDGLSGYGECAADKDPGYSYETSETAWHIAKDYLGPILLKQNSVHPNDFLPLVKGIRGHNMAKAGVEMALWDLWGKREGKSLKKLLGGVLDEVPVGVSLGIEKSVSEMVEKVSAYVEKGYQRVKVKIKPGQDKDTLSAIRNKFPRLPLQVDANSAYTLEEIESIKKLDVFNLLLIEQPLAEDDLWDHHLLQKEINTQICLDESIISVRHARQAIEMKACGIINIKAGRVAGLSQAVAIHDLCLEKKIPVWCGGMLETGVGRSSNLALASLPNFVLPGDISASDRYYEEDIIEEEFILNNNSTVDVPDFPGLGVNINQSKLDKVTLKTNVLKP